MADERDKGTVYFTYYGTRDDLNRYTFLMEWWQENFHLGPSWRGQLFFADPCEYIERARKAHLKVVEMRQPPLETRR